MICYGTGIASSSENLTVTFKKTYATAPIVTVTTGYINRDWVMIFVVGNISASSFQIAEFVKARSSDSGNFIFGGDSFNWIAIGRWK